MPMAEVVQLVSARRRGRPRNPEADLSLLDVLSRPQALALARRKGRGLGRERLNLAIATGELEAFEDRRLDRYGNPLLVLKRKTFEAWLMATLTPFHPAALPGASSNRKGPQQRAQ